MTTLPSRVRSSDEAQEALERDIAPRKRELFNLKRELASKSVREFVPKCAILLAYAHIEGATKSALTVLFRRMNQSGLLWRDVPVRLSHFEIDLRLARLDMSRRVICNDETTSYLGTLRDQPVAIDVDALMGRVGVVNGDTLSRILNVCQIESRRYLDVLGSLDETLIRLRHQVAHGVQVPIAPGAAEAAVDLALSLVDHLSTDFSNLLALQSWRGGASGGQTKPSPHQP